MEQALVEGVGDRVDIVSDVAQYFAVGLVIKIFHRASG